MLPRNHTIAAREFEQLRFSIFRNLSLMLSIGGIFWGLLAFFFKFYQASVIPLGFVVFATINYFVFRRLMSLTWQMRLLSLFSIALPFAFQTALGGWQDVGLVMIWSFIPLFGMIAFDQGKFAINWIGLTVLFVVLSVGMEDKFHMAYHKELLSGDVPDTLMAVNLISIICVVGFMIYQFVVKLQKSRKEINLLHTNLNARNQHLEQSLNYAKRIQQTLTPDLSHIDKVLSDNFQIISQKDDVGGDMIWMGREGDHVIISLIDCTGHGVSGGLLTMLVNDIMNETVHFQKFTEAKNIVTRLMLCMQERLVNSDDIWTDNADIGLLCFNKKTGKLTFSGCGINLHMITSEGYQTIKSQSTILNMNQICDRPQHEVELTLDPKCTKLYLASDGVFDMFGGGTNSRFGSQRFSSMLEAMYDLPFDMQKAFALESFSKWMQDRDQIDDISMLGLEVSQEFMQIAQENNYSARA